MIPKLTGISSQIALMEVALGIQKADLIITNCHILNVYTGELIKNHAICTKDKWIACVTQDVESVTSSNTSVIDAKGMTVIPGLIDGHTHLANYFSSKEFLKYAIPGGTTCLVTETLEAAYPVSGIGGIIDFIESYQNQPIKVFYTIPLMISHGKNQSRISGEAFHLMLNRDDVLGIGEIYWQGLLLDPQTFLPLINKALKMGKTIEGHSAGASRGKLAAYVGTGVSSCHEPIDMEQALERLRMGLCVMVREGGVRRDLEAVSKIKDLKVDLRRMVLVTDSVSPEFLIEKGTMEHVLQKAIDLGFQPADAIRMATLNVAEHFGIDHMVGGIAPGRFADMCVIPDIRHISPQLVISNGRIVARQGKCNISPREHRYSMKSLNTVNLNKIFSREDFKISAHKAYGKVNVRLIEKITDLVTREKISAMSVVDGQIPVDIEKDIIKVAALDRVTSSKRCFVALVSGVGIKNGAIASSASWDTRDITVMGTDESDMALAVNRIRQLQGGTLVTSRGRILAELPLPIMGLMSDLCVEEVAQRMKQVNQAAKSIGCVFDDPVLSLVTMTSAAIPYLRICDEGLFNLKDGTTRGLFLSEAETI